MSKPRQFWFEHIERNVQVESCFVLKSAYLAEKEAKGRAEDKLRKAIKLLNHIRATCEPEELEFYGLNEKIEQLEAKK